MLCKCFNPHQQLQEETTFLSGEVRKLKLELEEIKKIRDEELSNIVEIQRSSNASGSRTAIERWDTLSAHWEGLSSYWIRRLEQNSDEIRQELSAQLMSRQITDLSAAGANLFHAVTELQRLRTASERKFQRWYDDTPHEQEQAKEREIELEELLKAERAARVQTEANVDRLMQQQKDIGQRKDRDRSLNERDGSH